MAILAVALPPYLLLVLAVFIWRRSRSARGLPLPPGPPGLPIVGNALGHPAVKPWVMYHTWAKDYASDIIYLNMAGSSVIVLDSFEACVDLLERRSGLYSSRPPMQMFKLMGWVDWAFAFMPYGNHWRAHRRLAQQGFNAQEVKNFRPYQAQMVRKLLKDIRDAPHDFGQHLLLMTAQVILMTVYGLNADSDGDYIDMAEKMIDAASAGGSVGRYFVEAFPVLKYVPRWFPGAEYQREAAAWRADSNKYVNFMMSETEKQMDTEAAKYSFVAHHLGRIEAGNGTTEYRDRREIVGNVAGLMYVAAADTTTGMLRFFIWMMQLHPEVQRKAQAELSNALPAGHAPSFDQLDAGALPYITAVVKETIRHSAITAILIPHYIESEDEYKGYRIPSNSTVLGNAWAILHDEVAYPEPEKFMPERFLKSDGTLNQDVRDPGLIAFGFGRRTCPGKHFAYAGVWLTIASLLKAFEISYDVDEKGQRVEPDVKYHYGVASYPESFKCRIRPRPHEEGLFAEETSEENSSL